ATDEDGASYELHYIRNKEGHEIDFLLTSNKKPHSMVEVKWQDASLSSNFKRFLPGLTLPRVQVVGELKQAKTWQSGEQILPAIEFLSGLKL
ncbi:MAG TPA: hypothetical protein VMH83_01370, partial [Candidatus Acidoferrum sp.]|nr:hypothetical protein [Candidatus Acidoferrum sp.]